MTDPLFFRIGGVLRRIDHIASASDDGLVIRLHMSDGTLCATAGHRDRERISRMLESLTFGDPATTTTGQSPKGPKHEDQEPAREADREAQGDQRQAGAGEVGVREARPLKPARRTTTEA